jgi:hypothetical protein
MKIKELPSYMSPSIQPVAMEDAKMRLQEELFCTRWASKAPGTSDPPRPPDSGAKVS